VSCAELPGPYEAYVMAPGFALASASSSFTLFAGTDGCAASRWLFTTISTTGAKSRAMSQERFGISVVLIAVEALATSSV